MPNLSETAQQALLKSSRYNRVLLARYLAGETVSALAQEAGVTRKTMLTRLRYGRATIERAANALHKTSDGRSCQAIRDMWLHYKLGENAVTIIIDAQKAAKP